MESISLASGATYFPSPDSAGQAAITAIRNNKTYYGLAQGTVALREALANRYLEQNQTTLSPEQILITPGTKMALFNILSQLIKPGDEVILPVPNWFGLQLILEQLLAVPVYLPTFPENNYDLDLENLETLITPRTRLFLFCNPCNPTGRVYTTEEVQAVLDVLNPYPEIYILSDEIYDFVTYGKRVPSLCEFEDPAQRHIVVNGFSKSFAMSGWRIGYLIMPLPLVKSCVQFQDTIYSGVSEFVQEAALQTVLNLNTILPPMLEVLAQNKAILKDFLTELQVPFFEPEAAYYIFPDLSEYLKGDIHTGLRLCEYLCDEFKVEIRPGEYFGAPGFARISFALEPIQLATALERLRAGLESYISIESTSAII